MRVTISNIIDPLLNIIEKTVNAANMDDKDILNKDHSASFTNYDETKSFNERKDPIISGVQTVNEPEYEELDPRVQDELEKLNQCTDKINDFELQLEEANAVFRTLLTGIS